MLNYKQLIVYFQILESFVVILHLSLWIENKNSSKSLMVFPLLPINNPGYINVISISQWDCLLIITILQISKEQNYIFDFIFDQK